MANYNQSVLTTAGLALANRAAKGLAKFKITRVTSTADVVGSSDIPELAKLPSEVQVGSITGQQPLADGDETVIGTKVLFTNHNLQTSYKINAVGLYATEDGKTEILYSVITAIEPEFMPDFSDQVLMEFGMTIYVVVGQVDNMSIIVNPDSLATVAYVDKAIADHQVVFPETLTYSNRNEVITSKWTFAGGATDGKGNAYATTKDVATGLNNGLNTKVNVSDMRKPANDVLGLEDIKSSPLPNGTDLYTLINTSGQPLSYHASNYASAQTMVNKPTTKLSAFKLNTVSIGDKTSPNFNYTSLTLNDYVDGSTYKAFINTNGSGAITVERPWYKVADDSKVVHTTDMRKPASDVAGIEEVNAKQDKLEYTPANAANVVHRNPDTGVVSEPVDFTKLTVNGGKSVATSDDLKSLEDASWHTITGKSDSLSAYTCMYRKNNEQKYVDLVLYGTMGITMGTSDPSKELLDLSEIISSPKNVEGNIAHPAHAANGAGVAGDVSVSGTKILFSWKSNNSALYAGSPIVSTGTSLNSPFLRVTFD